MSMPRACRAMPDRHATFSPAAVSAGCVSCRFSLIFRRERHRSPAAFDAHAREAGCSADRRLPAALPTAFYARPFADTALRDICRQPPALPCRCRHAAFAAAIFSQMPRRPSRQTFSLQVFFIMPSATSQIWQ
jgi:hypothetical protein